MSRARLAPFIAPLQKQATAYGRKAPTVEKLAEFIANYDTDFQLLLLKEGRADELVRGKANFEKRQAELFDSSPNLGLNVHRRFHFSTGTAGTESAAYFIDMETYFGRDASEGLASSGRLLVVHEVRSVPEFLITRAWVFKDEEDCHQDRFVPGLPDYADFFAKDTPVVDLVRDILQDATATVEDITEATAMKDDL
jgi:hypothetical protein